MYDSRKIGGALVAATLLCSSSVAEAEEFKREKNLIEAGLYAGVFLPSSTHELYDFGVANHQELSTAFDVGLRVGYFPLHWLGAELEGGIMPTSTANDMSALGWAFRGHLVGQWQGRLTPFAVLGLGTIGVSSDDTAVGNDNDTAFHWGLGAKYLINHYLTVRLDLRHIVAPGLRDQQGVDGNSNNFEILGGVSYVWGRTPPPPPDSDKDGIVGEADKCPTVKGVAPDGCPPKDTDDDGVPNDRDQCPATPGPAPSGCPPKDTDGDGVPDKDDKCPSVKGTEDGCPPKDTDGDGIIDKEDKCPNDKGIAPDGCPDLDPDKDYVKGTADLCPDTPGLIPHGCPDKDGDGIFDKDDKCIDEPETKNSFQDKDGCPDEIPKEVAKFTGTIKGINFASGKADIAKSSFRILDQVVKVLNGYPTLRIEVQGHTDNTGDHDKNVELSQARADAVRQYLIDKGVGGDRISAKGFGPDQPVADNKDAKGRAQNRRIDFKLITQ